MKIKVGDKFQTNKCGTCIVVEYAGYYNIVVRFADGIETRCDAGNLRKGNVNNKANLIKIGDVFHTERSGQCTVIEYNSYTDILVKFKNGGTKRTSATHLRKRRVFNGTSGIGKGEKHKHTVEGVLDAFVKVHGTTYDYSKVVYTGAKGKVEVICPVHGGFMVLPSRHKMGTGCLNCSTYGRTISSTARIYVIQDENITKIGITTVPINSRISQINSQSGKNFREVYSKEYMLQDALVMEKRLHQNFRELGYEQPLEKFSGYTECFINTPLSIVIGVLEGFND